MVPCRERFATASDSFCSAGTRLAPLGCCLKTAQARPRCQASPALGGSWCAVTGLLTGLGRTLADNHRCPPTSIWVARRRRMGEAFPTCQEGAPAGRHVGV
jgi:hypothetical protein